LTNRVPSPYRLMCPAGLASAATLLPDDLNESHVRSQGLRHFVSGFAAIGLQGSLTIEEGFVTEDDRKVDVTNAGPEDRGGQ
jgi:hypothetical protein